MGRWGRDGGGGEGGGGCMHVILHTHVHTHTHARCAHTHTDSHTQPPPEVQPRPPFECEVVEHRCVPVHGGQVGHTATRSVSHLVVCTVAHEQVQHVQAACRPREGAACEACGREDGTVPRHGMVQYGMVRCRGTVRYGKVLRYSTVR